MIDWRCRMPQDRVQALIGDGQQWNCRDLSFHVVRVTFDQMPDPVTRAALEKIPTRFTLPEKNIDLLLDLGRANSAAQ